MKIEPARRVRSLPPYLFAEIDRQKARLRKKGKDIIDLSVGDPDIEPPLFMIRALKKALTLPGVHRYPPYQGTTEFRETIARWYAKNLKVKIDPVKEVWSLIGSKEGIAHLTLALVNPGELVLVPDPCFPMYHSSILFAGGRAHSMPLRQENGFLPDLSAIKPSVARKAKLMFLNYPNNPTGAVATRRFYSDVVKFAKKYNIIVCQDSAYSEIYYGPRPVSFLEIPGAKEVGVETRSFTKMFNIAGWRVGWVAGRAEVVRAVGQLKTNLDSGLFVAFQKACCLALKEGNPAVRKICKVYQERRDILVDGLNSLGWKIKKPQATFYLWVEVPGDFTSIELCERLLNKHYISTMPGIGFGPQGEGYIRFALTQDKKRIKQAIERLKKF